MGNASQQFIKPPGHVLPVVAGLADLCLGTLSGSRLRGQALPLRFVSEHRVCPPPTLGETCLPIRGQAPTGERDPAPIGLSPPSDQ